MSPRMSSNPAFLLYCRPGFEKEVAAETAAWLLAAAIKGRPEFAEGAGYVMVQGSSPVAAEKLRHLQFQDLVFARQGIIALPEPVALGAKDRVTPLVDAVQKLAQHYGLQDFQSVWIEFPDTNEGKSLSTLARGLAPYLEKAFQERQLLRAAAPDVPRLHVFLTSKSSAWIGWSLKGQSADWPLGIPRLRMPSGAPSSSTLKLVEAFVTFLGDDESRLIQPNMRAVDLGAAPGGWTWQLINRGC